MSVGVKAKIEPEFGKVEKKVKQANFANLSHAAAAIRLIARRSIRRKKKASAPGQPPHTRKGQLKRAILFAVDKAAGVAVIGPSAEVVGDSAQAHEKGGRFRRQNYPRRPTMGPALDKSKDRLPGFWQSSVS